VSRTLHDYITSHDVERDHELAATLRALEGEAHTWMQTAGPRAKAPLVLLPGKSEIQHLRTKMYGPADDESQPPLTRAEAPPNVGGLTFAELRARGGPTPVCATNYITNSRQVAASTPSPRSSTHCLPT
jgi:hypothetical protein